jgi:hypothetical protein
MATMTNNDLIHLLCLRVGHPTALQPQAARASSSHLINQDLFDGTDVTEKGLAWIEALHDVPLPVQTWVVPK